LGYDDPVTKALVRHQHAEQFHFITFSPQRRVAKGSISIWSDPAISGFQTASDYVLGLGASK
jgi:hypothetical protein